jgi:hypothetical protein
LDLSGIFAGSVREKVIRFPLLSCDEVPLRFDHIIRRSSPWSFTLDRAVQLYVAVSQVSPQKKMPCNFKHNSAIAANLRLTLFFCYWQYLQVVGKPP